jgi:hypothetical protein
MSESKNETKYYSKPLFNHPKKNYQTFEEENTVYIKHLKEMVVYKNPFEYLKNFTQPTSFTNKENSMNNPTQRKQKVIMDLEMLNLSNELGCSACGRKFSLGDSAVSAYGGWGRSAALYS